MSNLADVTLDENPGAQPAPALPVVAFVDWKGLTANFTVTPDPNDVNGQPTAVINIRSAFRVKGDAVDFAFNDAPGAYPAGTPVPVSITVPAYNQDYEFAFETGN